MTRGAELADAVAVIGMSCRFAPDLDSLDKFWTFLSDGRSAVSAMPDKRWNPYASSSARATAIMRQTTRIGSFLADIEGFDADFFGISPREAEYLDPQQRIVLELAWEALEHAGVPPLSLRGSETGVFAAANSNDYGRRLLEDIPRTGAYAVNGTTYYGIANRISYFLDLRGASVAVDTACAGSLTALHYACQSIRLGETPLAIVGGVNIMATPALFVALDGAGATAPDGRSKAFDKLADGYGRGEGAGVVVLKRLASAVRDGDPVLAVIRGTGVFQDGRSDGMMAPNSRAQEYMLRQVYRRAGIQPGTVDYVEAHGTGTPVGDREEAGALARVFGAGRAGTDPCLIGSLKPNIGHIEGGSGIAGVIKTILALREQQIPPSLHTEPNPEFDWKNSGLRLVGEPTPWRIREGGAPRRAGVSSYGVGGTIAHLILEEAPPRTAPPQRALPSQASTQQATTQGAPDAARQPAATTTAARPAVFPLSAMSEPGLRALAASVADQLSAVSGIPLASVGHTLALRRSHLAQRAAVVAASTGELAERLRALADGHRTPGGTVARTTAGAANGVVWVFSGHGAQWSGMGQQLLREEPSFAATIDALAEVFSAELGWTPRQAIARGGPWTTIQVQALTFAMQVGLAEVWRSHGLTPGAVIGHSVGEIAAAVAAGCIELQQAARFACRRAKALQRVDGQGGMALIGLPYEECERRLAGRTDVVAAIWASPQSAVISGDRATVGNLADEWRAQGIDTWRVDTDVAFHSPHLSAVAGEVAAAAGELTVHPATVDLYSTALTDPRSTAPRDSAYWRTNLTAPVRFAQAVEAAVDDGHRLFVEVSSHPVVVHSIRETFASKGIEDAVAVPTIRRNTDEVATLLGSLAEVHCNGAAVDWSVEHPTGELADLPSAVWQHRPYWIFTDSATGSALGGGHDPERHILLGARTTVSGAPPRQVWQTYLDLSCRPYPQSHEVVGVEITPAAVLINTFVEAAARSGGRPALTDILLRTPVAVTPPRLVQVVLSENTARMASRVADEETSDLDEEAEWITHCSATIDLGRELPAGRIDVEAVRARCTEEMTWERVDEMFRTMGVGGYAFPWGADELRRNEDEQLAVQTVEPGAETASSWAHVIDAALTISAVVVTPEDARRLWMSSHIDSVVFSGEPPARIIVHSRRSPGSPQDTVDVQVADEHGRIACEVTGLRFAPIQDEFGATATPRDLVHEIAWRPLPSAQDASPSRRIRAVLVVGDDPIAEPLIGQLEALGSACTRVVSPEDLPAAALAQAECVLVVPARARAGELPDRTAEEATWTLLRTVQRLAVAGAVANAGSSPKLWCVTQGVRAAVEEAALAHAPLWGVSRIIAGEHPELWGGTVDISGLGVDTGRRLLDLIGRVEGAEDVISLTAEETAVPRLTRIERAAEITRVQCHPSGTYLITGGLGALGLAVARWLVDKGARRLLLVTRRGLPPRSEWTAVRDRRIRRQVDEVLALEALGATVRVLALDITDADQVAGAVLSDLTSLPPVRGVVHAAGVVRDAMVDKVDHKGLREVLSPKAGGAMVLHRLFPPGSLDFLVFFSSCGQFARLTGQASYAAANSFLDALAAHRNVGDHTDTVSLAWTAWRGMGMSETIASTMLEANARGLDAVSPVEAFRAWSFGDRFNSPYQAILRVLPMPPVAARVPMFRELDTTGLDRDSSAGVNVVDEWADLPDEELLERVTADVQGQVAAELNLVADDVEIKRPLVEFGVDSVMTVALRVRLQRRYGLDLPPTILWNNPTVSALGRHLAQSLRARTCTGPDGATELDRATAETAAAGGAA